MNELHGTLAEGMSATVNDMSFVTFIQVVSKLLGIWTGQSRRHYSPEEIAKAAESDELDRILAEQGVQPDEDDGRPIPRRKFSELTGFDRKTLDADQYAKDLERKR
jgi:hypothetical protein